MCSSICVYGLLYTAEREFCRRRTLVLWSIPYIFMQGSLSFYAYIALELYTYIELDVFVCIA